MQRYRINYHWLIGVFVGGFVFSAMAFFVHGWQVERNADAFITRAEQAEAEGDSLVAFDYFRKYVQLRPKEEETRIRMGEAAYEVLLLKEATQEERGLAYGMLDRTVRATDNPSLRRKLAEFVIGFRPQDAIGHLEDLLVDNPTDPELNALLVRAYYQAKNPDKVKELAFKLVGYDREQGKFVEDSSSLSAPPDVYTLLATILRQQKKDQELAREVIDQMTEVNADVARAYLSKSIFLRGMGEKDEATESLNKAYELDPLDDAVLLQIGAVKVSEAEEAKAAAEEAADDAEKESLVEQSDQLYEQAKKHFAVGLSEHPENISFYESLASAEQGSGDLDAALKILDEGVSKFNKNQSVRLVLLKIDLLLKEKNYEAIEKELARLALLNRPDLVPVIDFQRARILYDKQKWVEASRSLRRVRPLLIDWRNYQVSAGAMLGHSYEMQGIRDLALDAYEVVLNDYPKHKFAASRRDKIRKTIQPKQKSQGPNIDKVIEEVLALPEADQDWKQVYKLVDGLIKKHNLSGAKQKLLHARILIKRGRYDEAQDLIRQASKEDGDDIDVHYAAVLLVGTDPERGPPVALKLLDRLEKKWGVSMRSRIRRADLLMAQNGSDVSEQLRALASPSDGMTEAELARMYTVIGLKFEQLNKLEEAREFWQKASKLKPNSLPMLMHVFDIAAREKNEESMRAAQENILKLVQDKENPSYILTEVKRAISGFNRKEVDKSKLLEARKQLDIALRQRPEWADLHVLYGHILLLLEEDSELALSYFDDAMKYGSRNAGAIATQVKLLAKQGLYDKALERMSLLNEKTRGRFLGRLEAEILSQSGDKHASYLAAKRLAASKPQDQSIQIWFSKYASRAGEFETAVDAMKLALESDSSNPDHWTQLVSYYTQLKDYTNVESSLRDANLAVDAEYLPLLGAKHYELQSRWQNAEKIYLAAYKGRFDELPVAHRMAEFYLRWASKDVANVGRASTYLNRILRAAYNGDATWQNPHVAFARLQSARLLARERDYQQSLRAERLLLMGTTPETLTEQDLLLLVDILVDRREPRSLLKAKDLLVDFHKRGRLTKKGILQLAGILSQTNEWDACSSLMLEAISEYRSDVSVWATYINLLIDRGEYTRARGYIKRLSEMNPGSLAHIQYSARIASEQGDTTRLRKLLGSLLPKLDGGLSEDQLKNIVDVARIATLYGDVELAEKLLRTYEKRVPGDTYPLTYFLALHGDPEEALSRMQRQYDDDIDRISQLAHKMSNTRHEEFGGKYDEQINGFIDAALRDDPDSISRQLSRAEASEGQGKIKESVAYYDQFLSRDDLPVRMRAAAMNNLGFQLALMNERLDEAELLINEAIETFGPVSDMLDTRAIVYLAQKKYDLAIEDLMLATSVDQDAVKFFHLAKAYILAGEGRLAQDAWKKAQDLGIEQDMLPRLERPEFDQIVQQIEDFQAQSAKL